MPNLDQEFVCTMFNYFTSNGPSFYQKKWEPIPFNDSSSNKIDEKKKKKIFNLNKFMHVI